MSDTEKSEDLENSKLGPDYPLWIAFKTMNERCQQLEKRVATVEEENMCLRLECGKDESAVIATTDDSNNQKTVVQTLKEKIEDLKKQKSQLTHQVFMVAAENRQLWNRLTKLTRTNKSLGSQLTKISDTLKQYSQAKPSDIVSYSFRDIPSSNKEENSQQSDLTANNGEKEQSLEEISLRLINSIMVEKSDLEQQYAEMVELQKGTELELQNIGFTYPEDTDTELELLKQHDIRLSQMHNTLLAQQTKLKRVLQNLKKKEGFTCNNCRMNANKKMCQTGTQFNFNENVKEHGATQTSLQTPSLSFQDNKICPLCGSFYEKNTSFSEFHEHVLSHFSRVSDDLESI